MKIGDTVIWDSQSRGVWKVKEGTVIAFIPKGQSARKYVPEKTKVSHIKFQDCSGIDRVLVGVSASADRRIMHYYCPHKKVVSVKHGLIEGGVRTCRGLKKE